MDFGHRALDIFFVRIIRTPPFGYGSVRFERVGFGNIHSA
jgi:hypothetical protein